MIENRRRVLDMLAEGKISVDEAERLLSLVDVSPPPDAGGQAPRAPTSMPARPCSISKSGSPASSRRYGAESTRSDSM